MRIKAPSFDTKKDLFSHLVENKKDLIKQKKSLPIKSDGFSGSIITNTETKAVKNEGSNPNELIVEVVANMSNWFDSHQDVMLPNSWAKSISEKGSLIYHLKDHEHETGGIIGDVQEVYSKEMDLALLGIKSEVRQSQALMMRSLVKKVYDEKTFELYKNGQIKQHSIGLQYVQIDLAVNDPEFADEFKVWNNYFNQVINKAELEEYGYFWAVKEAKIFENSAVLFGSNSATPTISTEESKAGESHLANNQPSNDTGSKDFFLSLLE
jgi:hypothetical protein